MKQNASHQTVTAISAAVLCAVLGFFGGMQYQSKKTPSGFRQFAQGDQMRFTNRPNGQRNGMNRPVSGEILSNDGTSVTVKMIDGSSKIVLISEKTQINKAAEATKTDLTVGTRVVVFGTENSDGSVTAQNVQLNPNGFGFQNGRPAMQPSPNTEK